MSSVLINAVETNTVKRISKLEFEKDIINELMEIFNVSQKEIDQVIKKEEIRSTNPLKINKRKRKQKDIIIKLIENQLDHHKHKKEHLLSLKDFIDIPTICIRCRKYGHHITDCRKEEIRSTNPLKINKRKRKQKDIIIKLIENLPNFHKDKKEYLLSLKDSIDIPTVCIRCRKYGHHITDCRKEEKAKK